MQPITEQQTPPAIALVAEPTLAEQLETVNRSLREMTQDRDTLLRKYEVLESDLGVVSEKLKAHEESPLTMALNTIDHGGLLDDAGVALNALMATVIERGKKGALAVVFTLKPVHESQFQMDAVIKVTEPQKEKPVSTFYFHDGKLTRNDPRQRQLPLNK